MAQNQQQITDALYLGNLDPQVNKRILYDICIQAGPVASVNIPESKDDNRPRFGFCHYQSVESAKYAHSLFQNTVMLYGRTMRVDYSPQGNPEAKSISYVTAKGDSPKAAAPLGAVAAAGGGFMLKRRNRNVDMTLPPPIQP